MQIKKGLQYFWNITCYLPVALFHIFSIPRWHTNVSSQANFFSQGQNRILVLLNEPLSHDDNVTVVVDRCGDAIEITNVKKRNPFVLQFSIPERCLEVSMLVGVRISKNGCPLGVRQVKCESRLRELDQILRAHDNPLEFICQVRSIACITYNFSSI